jgi:ADP-ribose pyrophosphatase YjhB (NUDIX family)
MVVNSTLKAIVNYGIKLYFILDESIDRRGRRIINLSAILKPFGFFFFINKDSRDARLRVLYFLNWFKEETKEYIDGDIKRIRSITIDTCVTIRLFWDLAERSIELSYVLFILYDSYGL